MTRTFLLNRLDRSARPVAVHSAPAPPSSILFECAGRGDMDRLQSLLTRDLTLVHACDGMGNRPLHIAAAAGHSDTVGLLLALGADADARNQCGVAPLHLAVMAGARDTVERLLRAGADANACADQGATPLMLARLYGDRLLLARLRAAGAQE